MSMRNTAVAERFATGTAGLQAQHVSEIFSALHHAPKDGESWGKEKNGEHWPNSDKELKPLINCQLTAFGCIRNSRLIPNRNQTGVFLVNRANIVG